MYEATLKHAIHPSIPPLTHPTPRPSLPSTWPFPQPARGATDETLQDEELQDWAKERAKAMLAKGQLS